jgi:hypothetical protein
MDNVIKVVFRYTLLFLFRLCTKFIFSTQTIRDLRFRMEFYKYELKNSFKIFMSGMCLEPNYRLSKNSCSSCSQYVRGNCVF